MKKLTLGLLVVSSLLLAGCKPSHDEAITFAKEQIASVLKDGQSARYQKVDVKERQDKNGDHIYTVCGDVNAKNSWGAYVGFRSFYVTVRLKETGFMKMNSEKSVESAWMDDGDKDSGNNFLNKAMFGAECGRDAI